MHTVLFFKHGITLMCCSNEIQLKSIMVQIYAQFSIQKPKILVLLDNILDGSTGLELYMNLKSTVTRFNLDI